MKIKNFRCGQCGESSTEEEWNISTNNFFDIKEEDNDDISVSDDDKEDYWFACPKCKIKLGGENIFDSKSQSATISIAKKEYNKLKEIESQYNELCK